MSPSTIWATIPFLILVFPFLICTASASQQSLCTFEYLYQFGDSLADTGNHIRLVPVISSTSAFKISSLPYGETYFYKPTGRYSDGLLVIDFIAKALNLPFLNPYLETNASFSHGANFAVGGSTALDNSFFTQRNMTVSPTNIPLSQQLMWFKQHLQSVSNSESEQRRRLQRALIIMGEIGGDDVNNALSSGLSMEETRKNTVPCIIQAISDAVREVIQLGATYIVVPGTFPSGCLPLVLTEFHSTDHQAYDDVGCLRTHNEYDSFFNDCLERAVASLTLEFPYVVIRYFDSYKAFESILHSGGDLGFNQGSLLKACCGAGGQYNYNHKVVCGSPGIKTCQNPAEFIHWDGVHLTQEAYRYIADHLIHDVLSKITCKIMNPGDNFHFKFEV